MCWEQFQHCSGSGLQIVVGWEVGDEEETVRVYAASMIEKKKTDRKRLRGSQWEKSNAAIK